MMPTLEARESLSRAIETAAGTGNMKRHALKRQLREWQKAARIGKQARAYKPRTAQEHAAMLGAIGVKVLPPPGAPSNG